jgi:hypothetical protein
MAVQSLKPRIDMMKARYGDDKKKIQRETSILYEQAGVNPLAGEPQQPQKVACQGCTLVSMKITDTLCNSPVLLHPCMPWTHQCIGFALS